MIWFSLPLVLLLLGSLLSSTAFPAGLLLSQHKIISSSLVPPPLQASCTVILPSQLGVLVVTWNVLDCKEE